ncbi:SHOCT domain-containing protein [Shewanella algae]|uniref:SHOCT domain-containing protein n=2 Tax=Shewanella algae TaxID=38313 RepID=UPI001AAD21B4|nr:SHOCT domain-containing protein [Shewanella algae]MBO2594393.1 SHOCT domain-containing protein [Shewanella algae]MBO2665750.1 SHOCT domain-containing protein [Shewanella algae]
MKRLACLVTCLILINGCSSASSIQRADKSRSSFENAAYEGEETVLRSDIPDSNAYRIFHQGATGFVSVQSVRASAESRAIAFYNNKNRRFELLRERISTGMHIAGNFPRAELVFACLENDENNALGTQMNKFDELRELKSLFDEGVLTETEYEQEKAKILAH